MRASLVLAAVTATVAMPSTPISEARDLLDVQARGIVKRTYVASCQQCSVTNYSLNCQCYNRGGTLVSTTLNLNRCITNTFGVLQWQQDGNFGSSCQPVLSTPLAGPEIIYKCGDGTGVLNVSAFNLDGHIDNLDGQICCSIGTSCIR
ncbi:hypothetical protein GQ53DRAFT_740553 [Thozetella sp. PMI_491]|nr:hypothetical protein GQ53DRAFT_740553 [Thozetella sp. PMI_491]